MGAIIEAENLSKVYNGQVAVDSVSFQLMEGEVFGFLGPNGAGKTTTLLMLLGLTEPSGGRVRVLGMDPSREPIKVKAQIGYLAENMGFYGDLNGREMLQFVADLNCLTKAESGSRIDEALRTVGLYEEGSKKISAYSRGMRQRLGIAEVLIKEPRVAFLDEPTLGLDPDASRWMMELIVRLSKERNMSVLLSSHMLNQVQQICHRVGIMIRGRLVACGPMDRLAKDKLGIGDDSYSLEEIYMKYFREG